METKTINLRDVPEELVRKAKVCAALRGLSLKGFVIEAVERRIEDIGSEVGRSAAFLVMSSKRTGKSRRQKR
jgi:hypothetical protein